MMTVPRFFVALTLLAGAGGCVAGRVSASVVAAKASPFPLPQVRLLPGPFQAAMERDAHYLIEIEPDRLLHNFRVNAGLPSTAEPLGNWEAPKSELRGHLTGHYLSACALMFASTGDRRFQERAALLVRELARCQDALGAGGYLSAFPDTLFDRLEAGTKVWAPYYTLHKILAGLIDAHTHAGNPQALAVATRLGQWVVARTDRLTDEQVERMLGEEHGGINEAMANLHALTGSAPFLRTAQRLCHRRVLDPLAARVDQLAGLHANTQIPKVIGAARLYELTGAVRYQTLADFFWERVVSHHSYVIGGNSDHEGFGPPDRLSDRVSPFTAESCNTYNMLRLTRHVFAWQAAARAADFYERALYNNILASQDPATGRMGYHVPVFGGWFMPYNTANDSAWCCTGSGFENHAKYGDSIHWHDADGVWVNLFIASELAWRERTVTLRQETRYPEEETTRFRISCTGQQAFTLRLRHPGWARRGLELAINGAASAHASEPGSFVAITRTWREGDTVELKIPMDLRLELMPDNASRAAICYGPLVLAGELGRAGITPPMPYAIKQSDYFTEAPPPIPVLMAGQRPLGDWLRPVPGRPLAFQTVAVGQPRDVMLVPFYRLDPQRFSLYWDVLTPEQFEARRDEERRQAEHRRELAVRTHDAAGIGDAVAERAHHVQGKNTNPGTFAHRPYRAAGSGGWFSYELGVPAGQPATLLCTYWGSDAGPRTFDVVIDGTTVATETLRFNRPGQFYDVEYELPAGLLAGKATVTVKFAAHAGQIAGGLYDVRVLRAREP